MERVDVVIIPVWVSRREIWMGKVGVNDGVYIAAQGTVVVSVYFASCLDAS
jgi:hypothetical protein